MKVTGLVEHVYILCLLFKEKQPDGLSGEARCIFCYRFNIFEEKELKVQLSLFKKIIIIFFVACINNLRIK